jgi:hypothetical protein
MSHDFKGHSKKKPTDPDVVGWFLGGQKSTRAGQFFFYLFYRAFEIPSQTRNTEKHKNVMKANREKSGGFFLVKTFFDKSFCKTFFVVPLNSHDRETPENVINPNKPRKKLHRNVCMDFLTWTRNFYKSVCVVFLHSPYRETPKNVLFFWGVGRFLES